MVKRISYVILFLMLAACILTHSESAVSYASSGLMLWFDRMIPTLLPFMILSGTLIRMHLAGSLAALFYPVLGPAFRVSRSAAYCILVGFLCGFPMGAKCVADLMEQGLISRREGSFLLAFCNNIGPVYFCGYVLPLLGIHRTGLCLLGMYGLPLLYGLALRFTVYRNLSPTTSAAGKNFAASPSLPAALDESVGSALRSIAMLGGYMVLFNLLNLVPHLVFGSVPGYLAPLLEISGGLELLGAAHPVYALIVLTFGGLSCIAQTSACIRGTGLSLSDYVLHKLILTAISAIYYIAVF